MLTDLSLIVLGIGLLWMGGETLVRHVAGLATLLGVSPFVIAFTVVAFGTSAPELAASAAAALRGTPDMALGNVVGSNSANIGLILGFVALMGPLAVEKALLRRELPFLTITALLTTAFCLSGRLVRWQGVVLLVGLFVFLWVLVRDGRTVEELDPLDAESAAARTGGGIARLALLTLLGLVMLVVGATVLIVGGQAIARALGVPEAIIGLSVVAFGTSVPELASCMVAARRGESGFILGNIIGSNVFNTLLILPTVVLLTPFETPAETWLVHLGYMIALSIGFSLVFLLRHIGRVVGGVLLLSYLAYVVWMAWENGLFGA